MRIQSTRSFRRDYGRLSANIKTSVNKQLALLQNNPRHPSIQLKRMHGTSGIWEAWITRSYRLTLAIVGDIMILRRIGPHDVLREP